MASFTDRLVMLIEAQVKNQGQVNSLAKDVGKADEAQQGATKSGGKLSQAWELVSGSGAGAAAAVGTVVAVAVKSLKAFEDLAKQSIDMGAALGISTDEASRWIAVADDFQIAPEAISKGLLSVEKSAAGAGSAIEAAGGQIRHAKDGTVDVTGTMESLADGLSSIHDPAQKAAAGSAIFGKTWKEIAPLMDEGGAAIDRAMKSVSDGQVITDGEAQSAEDMRLAQDRLSDSLGDLERSLGGVIAQFAPMISGAAALIEDFQKVGGAAADAMNKLGPLGKVVEYSASPFLLVKDAMGLFGSKAKDTKPPVDDLTAALKDSTAAADDMDAAYKSMSGALDQESALLRAKDAIDALKKSNEDAAKAATTGGADQVAAYRKAEEAAVTSKQAVIRYAQSIQGIPPEKATEINALIDQGDYQHAMLLLDQLSKSRTAHIDINAFASLTVAPGTPGTIRTYLPGQIGGRSAMSAAQAAAPPGATPMAAPPALGMSVAAPVIIIQSPMVGNPAHVADAVLAGYHRALRVNGPRAVTPEQVPA